MSRGVFGCGLVGLLVFVLGCDNPVTTVSPAGPPPPAPVQEGTPAVSVPAASNFAEAPPPNAPPATSVAAAKVIDLGKLARMPKAEEGGEQHLTTLSYVAVASVKDAFNFHLNQLKKEGWKEIPPTSLADEYASATLGKQGYILSLSVMPDNGKATVRVMNLGNVPLKSLPVPKDSKVTYEGPTNVLYLSELTADDARAEVRKLLLAEGWLPYGEAGSSLMLRKNAICLTASADAAPAQGGKTMISYSTVLMRREMPVPTEKVEEVSYSDQPLQVTFDANLTEAEVVDFYKQELAPEGWQPTTEQANQIDFEKFLIFRNPAKDLMEVTLRDLGEGKTRVALEFQTAKEVAAEEARYQELLAKKKKKEDNKPLPKVTIALPEKAGDVQADKGMVSFSVPSGTAKAAVGKIADSLRAAGWKVEMNVSEDLVGAGSFIKDDQSISFDYNDTGVLPAEIDIRAIGVELEVAKP